MNELNLGDLGVHISRTPKSLASIFELITSWSENPDRAALGKICSAAIVLSIEVSNAPKYNPMKQNVIDYGREALEFLLKNKVGIGQIYSFGSFALSEMIKELPNSEEVEEAQDFLSVQKEAG